MITTRDGATQARHLTPGTKVRRAGRTLTVLRNEPVIKSGRHVANRVVWKERATPERMATNYMIRPKRTTQ